MHKKIAYKKVNDKIDYLDNSYNNNDFGIFVTNENCLNPMYNNRYTGWVFEFMKKILNHLYIAHI